MMEILEKALSSLGKGFDITSDFRLKYCKGDKRLVLLNETETKQLDVPGFGSVSGVPIDIKCDKGDRTRYQSDVLEFNQMSELFNRTNSLGGKIPSGHFNSIFGFESSSWARDASNVKSLSLDGYFIVLFNLHIQHSPLLLLDDQVEDDVPSTWDPLALARFIEKYGTHILVGVSIGGKDMVLVKQDSSSNLQPSELKKHLENLGDQLFTGTCTIDKKNQQQHKLNKAPKAFNLFDPQPLLLNSFSSSSRDGITVICTKRGGDTSASSHCEWLLTVPNNPDAIHFKFIPITSLLRPALRGKGFLHHAINIYLRYKPPLADLQYFLDFQSQAAWAPIHNDLPLGPTTNIAIPAPALPLNLMGPKLYVNPLQVIVGKRPVTGMRLYLEGMKSNRLAIHLKHLTNNPIVLEDKMADDEVPLWIGSDEIAPDESGYLEPIQSKRFTHLSTAFVQYEPDSLVDKNIVYIVTGAQLHLKKQDSKNVLHLRLLFTKLKNSYTKKSVIEQAGLSSDNLSNSTKSSFFSSGSGAAGISEKLKLQAKIIIDSGVFPTGPPNYGQKLMRFVDTTEMCKGPKDTPGYWVVTGAKLDIDKGKICLHVKFSLLGFLSESSLSSLLLVTQ